METGRNESALIQGPSTFAGSGLSPALGTGSSHTGAEDKHWCQIDGSKPTILDIWQALINQGICSFIQQTVIMCYGS